MGESDVGVGLPGSETPRRGGERPLQRPKTRKAAEERP